MRTLKASTVRDPARSSPRCKMDAPCHIRTGSLTRRSRYRCWNTSLTEETLQPSRSSFAWLNGADWSLSPLDRKSTRLNSSHSQISYAVFCLKKKKKKTDMMSHDHEYEP